MNILFITEDHSQNNYGITAVVSQLVDELSGHSNEIQAVIAATGKSSVVQHPKVALEFIPPVGWGTPWRWSPLLQQRLGEIIANYEIDIIHLHGIWMAAQWAGLRAAKSRHLPCLLSVHGMLESWFWKSSNILNKFKKLLYFKYVLSPHISSNTVIHAITPLEKENLRSWFAGQKIVVIPNAISLKNDPSRTLKPEKYFVFLGRLHRIKGVELLIQAFNQANLGKNWRLVIAGPDETPGYTRQLKSLVAENGFSRQIEFIGPVYEEEKWDLVRRAWAMVVPSYSEVVGMVNLEAALCGVPSITTLETGLVDWNTGGGILIHPDPDELACTLLEASHWTIEERIERGNRSRNLVRQKYSWDSVIPQWSRLYTSLLGDRFSK